MTDLGAVRPFTTSARPGHHGLAERIRPDRRQIESEFGQQGRFSRNRGGETNARSTPRCRTTRLTVSTYGPPLALSSTASRAAANSSRSVRAPATSAPSACTRARSPASEV